MTREQALKIIDSSDIIYADYEELEAFSMAIAALRQPERKKAKWSEKGVYIFECSNCGDHVKEPLNYCPNCGAQMEGEI